MLTQNFEDILFFEQGKVLSRTKNNVAKNALAYKLAEAQ
jgi:hypothetical protein